MDCWKGSPLWDLTPKVGASRCQAEHPYSVALSLGQAPAPAQNSMGRRAIAQVEALFQTQCHHAACCSQYLW